MTKAIVTAAFGACLFLSGPALAMTDAECAAAWTTADTNKDGVVSEAENARYFAALRVASKSVADGKLTQAQFLEHCKADVFVNAKLDPGAPLAGANSFTEGQATDRLLAAGFSNVTGLKKDDNGVWRGMASNAGKSEKVAVDYKGNVVATP